MEKYEAEEVRNVERRQRRYDAAVNDPMEYTAEELAILKECNREALYQRGVPFAATFACGAFYGVKFGLLKSHRTLGNKPAMVVAGIVGCLAGTLSYKTICIERVLAVPNGTLRRRIEAAMETRKTDAQRIRGVESASPLSLPLEKTEKTESDGRREEMTFGTEMESYRSTASFDGFTAVGREVDESRSFDPAMTLDKAASPAITYDLLRQKNRQDYMTRLKSSTTGVARGPDEVGPARSVAPEDRARSYDVPPRYENPVD